VATIPSEETHKLSPPAATTPCIRLDLRTILYWYLHLFGFTLSSLLISWGLFFLFFLAIGGFSIDGMMHQLANMASRYVAADPARIASFKQVLACAQLLLAGAIIVLRRHLIIPRHVSEGNRSHG